MNPFPGDDMRRPEEVAALVACIDFGRDGGLPASVAVNDAVGATGQVGVAMRQILAERDFPVEEIRFFSSPRSAGKVLDYRGTEVVV